MLAMLLGPILVQFQRFGPILCIPVWLAHQQGTGAMAPLSMHRT